MDSDQRSSTLQTEIPSRSDLEIVDLPIPDRRKPAKRSFIAMAIVGLGLSMSAESRALKTGVINSMSGPGAPIAENFSNGIRLAEENQKK